MSKQRMSFDEANEMLNRRIADSWASSSTHPPTTINQDELDDVPSVQRHKAHQAS